MIPTAEPQAWRVRLQPQQSANPQREAAGVQVTLLAGVREPMSLDAVAEPIDLEAALRPEAEADGALTLMCVPAGATAGDLEKRAEAAAAASSPRRPPVRAGIRTVRVIWTETKTFVFGPPEGFADALDAVLRFTVAARLTFALETEMAATWQALDRDVPLAHSVTASQLKLQPQVEAVTEQVVRMNARRVRLAAALEQLDPTLAAPSKRLYAELVDQSALHDRLEALEAPHELAIAHYELVNTRLIEAKGMRTGHILELLIVVALALEVLLLALPMLRSATNMAPAGSPSDRAAPAKTSPPEPR